MVYRFLSDGVKGQSVKCGGGKITWVWWRIVSHKAVFMHRVAPQAYCRVIAPLRTLHSNHRYTREIPDLITNETGPLPLCTFSVMGLSMCSSILSESSPVRSISGIINELSRFPNSVPTVRCSYTSSSWHGHTSHAYCICFVGKH